MFLKRHSRFCFYNRYVCYQIFNSVNNRFICAHYSTTYAFKRSDKADDRDKAVENKIIYNSVIKNAGFIAKKRREWKELNIRRKLSENPLPLSLKYFKKELAETTSNEDSTLKQHVNLPYSIKSSFSGGDKLHVSEESCSSNCFGSESNSTTSLEREDSHLSDLIHDNTKVRQLHKDWMKDYEQYNEVNENDDEDWRWKGNYGTYDPSIPVSDVPCGGCGALLHCQDPAIPGYLPKELFNDVSEIELRAITCQRCHFLKHYNTALNVSVDHEEYPKLLSRIKNKKALVILMVDMTDFPCSIFPGIMEIIGDNRPLFVVGNKIDLLQGDSGGWIERAKVSLIKSLPSNIIVKHLGLISAKSGFGVEELINKLHNIWEYRGDVYLIGCTNVGKSTLFNTLLQSDYCKVKAGDLLQRATVSPWPGTTLNLLKFPILRPSGWRLYLRSQRLIQEKMLRQSEKELRILQGKMKRSKIENTHLICHVQRTFQTGSHKSNTVDQFSVPSSQTLKHLKVDGSGLDPNDPDFKKSHWVYDTPGVIHSGQIIDLLTNEELMNTLPKEVIQPRTFRVRPKQSLFIGGIARLDYVDGQDSIWMTVFAAKTLPVTICERDDAETIYKHYVGTPILRVPSGSEVRLQKWPGLTSMDEFSVKGIAWKESCADVVLSSAGWIAVTPGPQSVCRFQAWTPYGRGIYVRIPPVLPFTVARRGERISKTPAYKVNH